MRLLSRVLLKQPRAGNPAYNVFATVALLKQEGRNLLRRYDAGQRLVVRFARDGIYALFFEGNSHNEGILA